MKRQNKYRIALRSRPGINFTTAPRPEPGSFGRSFTGLLFFCLVSPGLFFGAQWLQMKLLAKQALLFVPEGPFLYMTALLILFLTGTAAISIIKRRNYLNPLFVFSIILLLLLSQTFFIRVTPAGIRCHELIWEKSYRWSAIRAAEISVGSFVGYPYLEYNVFTRDGRQIGLNPLIRFSPSMRELTAADSLISSHQVRVTVETVGRQLPVNIGTGIKKLIVKHAPDINQK